MYNNNNQDRTPAKVMQVFTTEEGKILAKLTEKGAVNIYFVSQSGREVYSHTIKPSGVKLHAELGCPFFTAILESPMWAQITEAEAVNRVQDQVNAQVAKELHKVQQYQQAAIDKIRALGLDPETVLKSIKTA